MNHYELSWIKRIFALAFFFILLMSSNSAQSQLDIMGNETSADGNITTALASIKNNNYSRFRATSFSEDNFRNPQLQFIRSRGTSALPKGVLAGDRIGGIYNNIYVDGNMVATPVSSIEFYTGSIIGPNNYSSYINFLTISPNKNFREERMRITENGNIGIGTIQPLSKLHIKNGDIYLEDIGTGVILRSPNGKCWRMNVTDLGGPEFTEISCPN